MKQGTISLSAKERLYIKRISRLLKKLKAILEDKPIGVNNKYSYTNKKNSIVKSIGITK